VFLEHGYTAASMDEVAQRAGVSKTTLYARFQAKEALFTATITAECERHGMAFAARDFDGLGLEAALGAIGRRFVELVWSPDALRIHRIVTGEAARFPEVARLFVAAGPAPARAAVAAYMARAAARGLLRPGLVDGDGDGLAGARDGAEFVARQFLAALQGGPHCELTLGLRDPPDAPEREAFVARAVALFVEGAGA
jgi:TetR/AcrR family transcriptional repressor of mexJK operon